MGSGASQPDKKYKSKAVLKTDKFVNSKFDKKSKKKSDSDPNVSKYNNSNLISSSSMPDMKSTSNASNNIRYGSIEDNTPPDNDKDFDTIVVPEKNECKLEMTSNNERMETDVDRPITTGNQSMISDTKEGNVCCNNLEEKECKEYKIAENVPDLLAERKEIHTASYDSEEHSNSLKNGETERCVLSGNNNADVEEDDEDEDEVEGQGEEYQYVTEEQYIRYEAYMSNRQETDEVDFEFDEMNDKVRSVHQIDDEEDEESDDEEHTTKSREEVADLFAYSAMSLGVDNDDLLFNMLYFSEQGLQQGIDEGGDESNAAMDDAVAANNKRNIGMHFRNMLNNAVDETIAAHSANNTPYKLQPVEESEVDRLEIKKYANEEDAEVKCSVCREILQNNDESICLPVCSHTFHAHCLKKWLDFQSWCPICRSDVIVHGDNVKDNDLTISIDASLYQQE